MYDTIPIRNIYYLLSYAWDVLRDADRQYVDASDYSTLPNLFASVLVRGVEQLHRQGFRRSYIALNDEIAGIKGKMVFNETVKRNTLIRNRTICEYDHFTEDIPINQILKATLIRLSRIRELEVTVSSAIRYLTSVSTVTLTPEYFQTFHKQYYGKLYALLIEICYFTFQNINIDERTGSYTFREYSREKGMEKLFESFVRNFYRKEQSTFRVSAKQIRWSQTKEYGCQSLPMMQTDVFLESDKSVIILDTKYYNEAFSKSQYAKVEKIRSDHIYQLLSYIHNFAFQNDNYSPDRVKGILLYPTLDKEIDERYEITGYPIAIKTLNLNDDWRNIHTRLIDIIEN